MADDDHEILL